MSLACTAPGCSCVAFECDVGDHPGVCRCGHDDGQHAEPAPFDWTVFDGFSESTATCACGATWRTHGKAMREEGQGRFYIRARKPCPACGSDRSVRALRGDPETMVIRGVGKI